ncbi:peptidase U32 family protein [Desulfobotulus mexicanus]|uniref:U32 family peptidase n=1 Tax=Desulfobotulus mexicanus TaxID=2586642 RepID=A0A5S5MFS9_9BACT|nr:peptidase U32 family protein [Desulfobotulus mexicanus]TYT74586.1 U32 family peptidase [Desulfobotulus mexicanus]
MTHEENPDLPMILSPAGDRDSFLAAIAAEADAIYCGLKAFSARMEADNFSITELAALTSLAHDRNIRVYVALNNEIKPDEVEKAFHLVERLARDVMPDALIVQDPAFVSLARQVDYAGELHLSTLANLSFPEGLAVARKLGFSRVVMPRELDVDALRLMAAACPEGMNLEAFVHGALCYAVSGRCYWSSYLGGKSGLRGRCVQPCRRIYRKKKGAAESGRYFSMQDLSLDVLTKVLGDIPEVGCWKIEGRKKGPHYVHYTTTAYRMLRDERDIPGRKKDALALLDMALGRPSMHYRFLPHRPWHPVSSEGETGSGFLLGRVKGGAKELFIVPRVPLLAGDLIRIGYEGEGGHLIVRVRRSIPKGGKFHLKADRGKRPVAGAAAFLVDRREPELMAQIQRLSQELETVETQEPRPGTRHLVLPRPFKKSGAARDMLLQRKPGSTGGRGQETALWVDPERPAKVAPGAVAHIWWWLDPATWPEGSENWKKAIDGLLHRGARRFVLNAPWQMGFFGKKAGLELWAGPFCNVANPLAVGVLGDLGFSGVFASPELSGEDFLAFAAGSPLPVGAVLSGCWPLAISRISVLEPGESLISPMDEKLWGRKYGENQWLFPDWQYDIREKKVELERAGYRYFVHMEEILPKGMEFRKRPGLWNWNLRLL